MNWNPLKWFTGGITKSTGLSKLDQLQYFNTKADNDGTFETLSTSEQLKAIRNNALVFGCIRVKSNALTQAPLIFENDAGEEFPKHNSLYSLQNNPWLSESDILQYMYAHLDLTGKSFVWKWYNTLGEVRELWPIPPSWVTIHTATNAKESINRVVIGYTVKTPGDSKDIYIPAEDMMYTRYPDPLDLTEGISPLAAASRNYQLDNLGDDYKGDSMQALQLPGMVVTTSAKMSNEQKEDLRAVLKQKMGKDARENALILSGAKDIKVDVLNPLDTFNWASFSSMNETRLCMVFGVPPMVVGALVGLERSTFSNMEEANRWFYNSTMVGLWKLIESTLTHNLVTNEMQGKICFDLREIPALRESASVLETRAKALFDSGVITRNEAREIMGYNSDISGNVYKYPLAVTFEGQNESATERVPDDLTVVSNDIDDIEDVDDKGDTNEGDTQ